MFETAAEARNRISTSLFETTSESDGDIAKTYRLKFSETKISESRECLHGCNISAAINIAYSVSDSRGC